MKYLYLWGLLACAAVQAGPVTWQSGPNQTALVELYTSEGCSSCSPAEACLSALKTAPGLWRDFVPVAFHVEYWDNDRWRDKWSSPKFTDRQRAYTAIWNGDSIYTPEFILNGREWRDWPARRAVPSPTGSPAGVLALKSDDGLHWQVTFTPTATYGTGYEMTEALLDSEVSSDVKGGENTGRHLKHDFAAIRLSKHALTAREGKFLGEFTLAEDWKSAPGRPALACWVTRAGKMEPLQTVGGWLPKSANP